MKNKIVIIAVIIAAFASSIMLHIWEIKKINEFSDTFETLSQIELKRTSLMVLQQQVLQNVVREVENGKKQDLAKTDFNLPDKLETHGGK